jgi:hypothetical protein
MNAIVLPEDLQAWAEAEVAAGHAVTVEQVAERALRDYRSQLERLRQRQYGAEAEVQAGRVLYTDDGFADIKAKLDFARDQVKRGEALDGDAFLAQLDSWIAQDVASEPTV